jgi:gliding motility-associated lipoprotein GldD
MKLPALFPALLLITGLISCQDDYTPKPRGFFRIDLPEKSYQEYKGDCPFTFEHPVYSAIEKDDGRNAQPCWLDIKFPRFNATLHLSYRPVNKDLNRLVEDSRSLVYKHTVKAEAINEAPVELPQGVAGILYGIEGNTASSLQFHLTDSTRHFLRGSLYFYNVPQADSVAPVQAFLEQDIRHMIQTFRWK